MQAQMQHSIGMLPYGRRRSSSTGGQRQPGVSQQEDAGAQPPHRVCLCGQAALRRQAVQGAGSGLLHKGCRSTIEGGAGSL